MILRTASGVQITVENTPFARGGEGAIHRIISPSTYHNCCVKLYFQQYRTERRRIKTEFQVKNRPNNIQSNIFIVCWPIDIVYDGNNFVGFSMPLAFPNSHQLYEICLPSINILLPNEVRSKFDRKLVPSGLVSRLKLCVNIAGAIHEIHRTNQYVMVDMKPQNILFTPGGKISIIDIDSIQISNKDSVLYNAAVATPEYVPMEGQEGKINPSTDHISVSWDNFSLAVIFYEIKFGIHPYAATFKGCYADFNTISEKIKHGLFVHGSRKNYVEIAPKPHENFFALPASIRKLFMRAFDAKQTKVNTRPSSEEWGKALFKEIEGNNNPNWRKLAFLAAATMVGIIAAVHGFSKFNGTSVNQPPGTTGSHILYVNSDSELNIRACPGIACEKLGQLKRSSAVEYLGKRESVAESNGNINRWIKVKLVRGEYCAAKNIVQYGECVRWVRGIQISGWVSEKKLRPS